MRLPSDQRARVSRGLVLRAALAALLAALTIAPIADAARSGKGDTRRLRLQGRRPPDLHRWRRGALRRRLLGRFARRRRLLADARHARRLAGAVHAQTRTARAPTCLRRARSAAWAWASASPARCIAQRSLGSANVNAAGVYGRLQARGKGTVIVNGEQLRWNSPLGNSARSRGTSRSSSSSPSRAHRRRRADPPAPAASAATTTTTTTTTVATGGRQLSAPGCGRTASLE